MGQTLTNGIFLPDEGERNCYTGLAANWRALDYLIGGYNVHVADAVIHVTQEDRDKWDAVTGKADDTDTVHKTGNETISGTKSFSSTLSIANTDTTANTPNLNLRNYNADRGTNGTTVQTILFADKNAKALTLIESRRVNNGNTVTNILTYNTDDSNNTVSGGIAIIRSKNDTNFAPSSDNAVTCGRSLAKWSDVLTYKVNGLEPSSVFMPVNRGSRIDISGYFTNVGSGYTNDYDVIANGYIFLNLSAVNYVMCYSLDGSSITNYAQSFSRMNDGQLYVFFPVRKGDKFRSIWYSTGGTVSVSAAYFIPCQGNV